MTKIFFTLIMTLLFSGAHAQENLAQAQLDEIALKPIYMPGEVTIKAGDTKIIPLPRYAFVDRISLDVKTGLLCAKDSFRISFDGYAVQNVNVEGGLQGYRTKILYANTNARNIEIYNAGHCKIKVKNIEILPRRWSTNNHHTGGTVYFPVSEASAQVSFLLESILYLDALVADTDRIQYLSPGKKAVGKALAVLNSAPETSQASLRAIQEVINYLNSAQVFYDRLATVEATFEIAQEIQSVKVTLERMIR